MAKYTYIEAGASQATEHEVYFLDTVCEVTEDAQGWLISSFGNSTVTKQTSQAKTIVNNKATGSYYATMVRKVTFHVGQADTIVRYQLANYTNTTRGWYVEENGEYVDSTIPSIPTMANWTVIGWTTEANSSATATKVDTNNIDAQNVYAMYKRTMVLNYNLNGVAGEIASQNKTIYYTSGSEATTSQNFRLATTENIEAPEGKEFMGWISSTEYVEDGAIYTPNLTVNATSYTINLTAQWGKRITYTLTFDVNGADRQLQTQKVKFGTKYGELPTVTKSGYEFVGWKLPDSNKVVTAESYVAIEGDHTVTAVWADGTIDANFKQELDYANITSIRFETKTNLKEVNNALESASMTGYKDTGIRLSTGIAVYARNTSEIALVLEKEIKAPTDISNMFAGFEKLQTLVMNNLDLSEVENMSSMFKGSASLTMVDFSGKNMNKATNMSNMFMGCTSLKSVYGVTTNNVEDYSGMFYGCKALTDIDLQGFNTSKAKTMNSMFAGCTRLETLNLYNFTISLECDVENMLNFGLANNIQKITTPSVIDKDIKITTNTFNTRMYDQVSKEKATSITTADAGKIFKRGAVLTAETSKGTVTDAQGWITDNNKATKVVLYDEEIDATMPTAIRDDGYGFDGWSDQPTAIKQDTVITANWQQNYVNVNIANKDLANITGSIKVYLKNTAGNIYEVTTNANTDEGKKLTFRGIPTGKYIVYTQKLAKATVTMTGTTFVANRNESEDEELVRQGTLTVYAQDLATNVSIQSIEDTPISQMDVAYLPASWNDFNWAPTTNIRNVYTNPGFLLNAGGFPNDVRDALATQILADQPVAQYTDNVNNRDIYLYEASNLQGTIDIFITTGYEDIALAVDTDCLLFKTYIIEGTLDLSGVVVECDWDNPFALEQLERIRSPVTNNNSTVTFDTDRVVSLDHNSTSA